MNAEPMRRDITRLIDDIKYHSDALTSLDRLPIIQLNIILAKMTKMVEKTIILKHYIEEQHDDSKSKDENAPSDIEIAKELNEHITKLSKESKTDIGEKLQEQPIASIKSAIGIYEKYLFANELFNGSITAFEEAVNELDSFGDIEKATLYIEEGLMVEYDWKAENEHVDSFKKLVQRRYQDI